MFASERHRIVEIDAWPLTPAAAKLSEGVAVGTRRECTRLVVPSGKAGMCTPRPLFGVPVHPEQEQGVQDPTPVLGSWTGVGCTKYY